MSLTWYLSTLGYFLLFIANVSLVVVVQLLSPVWLFETPWAAACQAFLSFTVSWSFPKSCPLSWWCYLTISSSVAPFFSALTIFSSIRVSPNKSALHMKWSKQWSFSFGFHPTNKHSGLISLRLTALMSWLSRGPSKVFSSTTIQAINSSALSFLSGPTLTSVHDYWKNHSFDYLDFCWQVISLLFNVLSGLS